MKGNEEAKKPKADKNDPEKSAGSAYQQWQGKRSHKQDGTDVAFSGVNASDGCQPSTPQERNRPIETAFFSLPSFLN